MASPFSSIQNCASILAAFSDNSVPTENRILFRVERVTRFDAAPLITRKTIRNELTFYSFRRNVSVRRKNLKDAPSNFVCTAIVSTAAFAGASPYSMGGASQGTPTPMMSPAPPGGAPGHGRIRDGHKRQRLRLATVQRRLHGLRSYAPGKNQIIFPIHVT